MIVKIQTNDCGWEYFNVPKGLKTRLLTEEQTKYVVENWDKHYIITKADDPKYILRLMLINIYDTQKIYTDCLGYILNDNGKTIEKIN